MTTWAVGSEPDIQELLDIPNDWVVAAVVPLGKPTKQLTKLKRKPVEDILFENSCDGT